MKSNSRLVRRMKMFTDVVAEEALKRPPLELAPSINYHMIQDKFRRAMDAHEQHGPVRVLVANGKRVGE